MDTHRSGPLRPGETRHRVTVLPETVLGWQALGLAAAAAILVVAGGIIPRGAALGLALGLAGGVAALAAIARRGERGLTVLVALVPLVVGVGFVVAELIFPHG